MSFPSYLLTRELATAVCSRSLPCRNVIPYVDFNMSNNTSAISRSFSDSTTRKDIMERVYFSALSTKDKKCSIHST
eukprot:6214163-Pleurochrysis_carterae.AAC.1